MRWILLPFLTVFVSSATSSTAADPVELTPPECVKRLETLTESVAQFQSRLANEPGRLGCVQEIVAKLRVLTDLGRQSAAALVQFNHSKDEEAAMAEKEKLLGMVARADQLAEAARNCTAMTTVSRPQKSKPEIRTASPPPVPATNPAVLPSVPRPSWPARTEADCIRQGEAAGLLARVLGVAAEKAVTALSARHIEPLGGWQPAECLTVDDFCVAVARALALKVEGPEEPSSYVQALRDAGLPVDQCLPPRSAGVPSFLTAAEIREFLAAGKAAPLQRVYAPTTH